MGPRSRELLSRLTDCRPVERAFPFGTSREIDLGLRHRPRHPDHLRRRARLGAVRARPSSRSACTRTCCPPGADLGVVNGGYYAIDSLRLEKGYRAFGRELTPDYTPVDAGLLFACKLRTDIDFLGRAAVERGAGPPAPRRKLVSFVVDDPDAMLWGGELVLRDGVPAGQVTSAAWGATVGAGVGLAYLWDPAGGPVDADWVRAASYEVAVGADVHAISVSLRPLVDPEGSAQGLKA